MAGKRFHLVSLGCAKNRVDSEVMLGHLLREGWSATEDPAEAELVLVNTCSFIQPATQESINTILEMARTRNPGARLVVTGCLVQRYGKDLEKELPEVDAFLGTGAYDRFPQVLEGVQGERSLLGEPGHLAHDPSRRVNSWSKVSAFLKISEGCDRTCTFCAIPSIRGRQKSRRMGDLVEEARVLADQGVLELNLVAQDTTAYGQDLGDGTDLAGLLHALASVRGIRWIRVLYAHPLGITDRLLHAMAALEPVCRYLDIPLQHASAPVLRAMGRRIDPAGQRAILDRIRAAVPDIALRTTFLVGFPGETDDDFQQLLDFIQERHFVHVGAFPYWREEGTPAARLRGQVPARTRKARVDRLLRAQSRIAEAWRAQWVGQPIPVLVEGPAPESPFLLVGRASWQAPEVDGQIYVANGPGTEAVGALVQVHIRQAGEADLVGDWAGGDAPPCS